MKKISAIFLISLFFTMAPNPCGAFRSALVDGQRAINEITAAQFKKDMEFDSIEEKINTLTLRYINNLRDCKPIHINNYMDFFGLKLSYKVDVDGWSEERCTCYLSGKIGGIGDDLREVFEINISDETFNSFEPKLRCDFTQEQLNIIVDAIIANYNKRRDIINSLLEDPQQKYLDNRQTSLTPEEQKVIEMFLGNNVCTLLNQDELFKTFENL